jgi:hypothetical protein
MLSVIPWITDSTIVQIIVIIAIVSKNYNVDLVTQASNLTDSQWKIKWQ